MLRRLAAFFVMLLLAGAICPAPVRATSTQAEIEMGRQEDEQIVDTNVIETDPLLNAYVQHIASNLWKQVDRKDIPYNVKIIKDPTVDSFATLGGYIYIDEGIIDFVQSDDELAGVMGHETGHIERRHVLTSQSKLEGLNLLFGIASLFSPIIYEFGNLMEAGMYAKIERSDELQADRTGLQLMARAGYDPENMKTMLEHLAVLGDEHNDIVNKYLEDHPDPAARVSHLMGYPELDPKIVTEDELVVRAASDRDRARYSFSAIQFQKILKTDPRNAEALLGLGQDQIALGFPSKSQQTLAEAMAIGSPQTKALANEQIEALRSIQAQRVNLTDPDLSGLHDQLTQAEQAQTSADTEIAARRDQAKDQLKQIETRTAAIAAEPPPFGNVNIQHGSRLEAVYKNLMAMSRSLNSAMADASTVIDNVGSLETDKQYGLLKQSNEILAEMQQALNTTPTPPDQIPILGCYPSIFAELQRADSDMIRSVDAARASLTTLDQSLGDLDDFLRRLDYQPVMSFRGDINANQYNDIAAEMNRTLTGLNNAATQASQAAQLYNMARTRQLSARITLLGVGSSPERYATLQYALQQRFGIDGIPYDEMVHDGITAGDVTVATILAADIRTTPDEIIEQMISEHKSPVDLADEHGMHAWPLEIFTGLVYLDYTDDPVKEMQEGGGSGGSF
ncbi:MAG TPA: M48 family metalloprotease [Candidatus Acidoferrales bacterium]|nr:M48 family metalloprotease [Candidatus Acidoferrales bacterium]